MIYVIDTKKIWNFFCRDDVNFSEVARKTGISKMTLSNIRNGKTDFMKLKFHTLATLQLYIDNYFLNDDVIKIFKLPDYDIFIYRDKVDVISLDSVRKDSFDNIDLKELNALYQSYINYSIEGNDEFANQSLDDINSLLFGYNDEFIF